MNEFYNTHSIMLVHSPPPPKKSFANIYFRPGPGAGAGAGAGGGAGGGGGWWWWLLYVYFLTKHRAEQSAQSVPVSQGVKATTEPSPPSSHIWFFRLGHTSVHSISIEGNENR